MRLAQVAMAHRDTSVSVLCSELGIKPVTLYRYVGPQGELLRAGQEDPRHLNRELRQPRRQRSTWSTFEVAGLGAEGARGVAGTLHRPVCVTRSHYSGMGPPGMGPPGTVPVNAPKADTP